EELRAVPGDPAEAVLEDRKVFRPLARRAVGAGTGGCPGAAPLARAAGSFRWTQILRRARGARTRRASACGARSRWHASSPPAQPPVPAPTARAWVLSPDEEGGSRSQIRIQIRRSDPDSESASGSVSVSNST